MIVLPLIGFLFVMGSLFIEGCRGLAAIVRWLWRSHRRGLARVRAAELRDDRQPHRPGKAL